MLIEPKSIIHDTKAGISRPAKMVHLEGLIVKTTGATPEGLMGVLKSTSEGAKHVRDSVVKSHVEAKTQPRSYGQIPYAGKMY